MKRLEFPTPKTNSIKEESMLVLSRKKNESIVIGDNVQIEVLKVSGNTVRIGIKAPREVKVLRGELAPYGLKSDESSSGRSLESVRENRDDYDYELTLPLENGNSVNLPNPFVAKAM